MRQRHGYTLVEIMVALVIMGLVTGAVYKVLNTSQRLSLAQAEQVTLQSNVRTGALVVPNELRELNTVLAGTVDQNDIRIKGDDHIRYRAMRGLGFLCQQALAGALELRFSKATWTGLGPPLAANHDLYLFDDGNPNDAADDRWQLVTITGVASSPTACGGNEGFVLSVAALPVGAPVHTPVRLFEEMEMKLHPADGKWWLGAGSVKAGGAIEPVLGPLTNEGFGLEYFNSTGLPTADASAVKSIRVTVRGLTDGAVRPGGTGTMGHLQDSLVSQVLLRNSIRP